MDSPESPTSENVRRRVPFARISLAIVVTAGLVAGCAPTSAPSASQVPHGLTALASPSTATAHASPATSPAIGRITYPRSGSGHWLVAGGSGTTAGTAGRLLRYQVVVERDITGVTAADFAAAVVKTLGDKRSWAAQGSVRLQRVGPHTRHDFTIYLATPETRDKLCGDAAAGNVDRYTSCHNVDKVVLNVARWAHAVPSYGASLSVYREYMVNHETGHQLGYHHELCTGAGKLAPVMEQQTLGLHGCRANGWPTVNQKAYHGRLGQYNDPVPAA